MKLSIEHIFYAYQSLAQISNGDRNMTQKGKYRLARLFRKLKPEYELIVEQRDTKIKTYDYFAPEKVLLNGNVVDKIDDKGAVVLAKTQSVPDDKNKDFFDWWKDFAKGEVEIADIEPIPFVMVDLGDNVSGSLSVGELVALGSLIGDP